jgi:hypothetical protein
VALVLVSTAGAPNANSYASVADGDAYHEGRLFSTVWTAAVNGTKEAALVWATRVIDTRYTWAGYAASITQALGWPRSEVWDRHRKAYLDTTVVPDEIKWATAELARLLISSDRAAETDVERQGITDLTAGPVSLSFRDVSDAEKVVSNAVLTMIPPWWGALRGAMPTMIPLRRA